MARVCVVCKTENESNATTCIQCGSPLRISNTVSLSGRMTREAIQQLREGEITLERGMIALYLEGQTNPVIIRVEGEGIILGRNMGNPDPLVVDLTPYSAGLLGVSRQHASIQRFGNTYALEDLNSTNGTWINNTQLSPNKPHVLEGGDAIRLGELVLYIRLTSR